MGYFANATEGDLYWNNICGGCIHDINMNCPVWAAHMIFNYQECNNKDSILHMLIPLKKDGSGNEKCKMFIAK